MNIQAEKLLLIDKIINTTDNEIILRIKDFFDRQVATEPWDELSDEEKVAIERGLKQADSGEKIDFEEVKAKYSKWLKK